jgi:hypothetical protein
MWNLQLKKKRHESSRETIWKEEGGQQDQGGGINVGSGE